MAKRVIENRTVIDGNTGLVLEQERELTVKTEEPDYVKLYLNAWCVFKEVKGVNLRLLYKILPFMTYAESKQLICFTAYVKKEISKTLGWSEKSALNRFNQEIKKMCVAGVLKKLERDTYQVNPELIGRGSWKDIRKLRATFNLETGEVSHEYDTVVSPHTPFEE